MPSRTARLSKKGCGFATPECRAQRDLPVHAGPAAPALLPAAPHRPATTLGYMEISWVIRLSTAGQRVQVNGQVGRGGFRGRRVPSGALAPALKAAFVIGAAHQIEGKVAHNRHVLGPVALAQA